MKKLISLLLAMAMALSMLSIPTMAAELNDTPTAVTEETTPSDSSEEEISVEEPAEGPDVEPEEPDAPAEDSSEDPEEPPAEIPDQEEAPDAGDEDTEADTEETAPTEEEMPDATEEAPEDDTAALADVEDNALALLGDDGFTISESTHTVTVIPTAKNEISPNLGKAIQYAGTHATASQIWTVKVPAGNYTQYAPTRLYPNVTLNLTGVTLHYTANKDNMFFTRTTNGGYNDNTNITILGGTLYGKEGCSNSTMHIAHGKNVVLNGTTFAYSNAGHQLEVAGVNGLTVKNCTFKDLTPGSDRSGGCEPLQMDILASNSVYADDVYDGTPMKNVKITGCTFTHSRRGIGVHSQLLGSYHTGLEISNCTFSGLTDTAIYLVAFRNCTIRDNFISNCGQGIYMSMIRNDAAFVYTKLHPKVGSPKDYTTGKIIQKDASSKIYNNKISVYKRPHCGTPTGIWLYGQKFTSPTKYNADTVPAGTYAISNVSITNNTIHVHGDNLTNKNYAYGIRLNQAQDCTISRNTIDYSGPSSVNAYGIFSGTESKRSIITSNTISKFARYAIRMRGTSQATSVNSNKLSGSGADAVRLSENSAAASISYNTITSSAGEGISIEGMKSKCSINKNIISGCAGYPILVSNNAAYTTTLNYNTLTAKTGKDNMLIKAGTISASENTFTGGASAIHTASGVKGSIGNSIFKTTGLKHNINGTRSGNTAATTISSAAKSSTGALKVKWSHTSSAAGYVVQYSTSSNMSSPKTASVSGGFTLSKTISGLTKGKRYYARVRAYRTVNGIKIYGKYSSIKSAIV